MSRLKYYYTFLILLFSMTGVAQTDVFRIGTATKIINNRIDGLIQGAGVSGKATAIRDDLEGGTPGSRLPGLD